jgi:phage shock protein C
VSDRLYRSRDDRMLAGVAGGLAEIVDADPSIIRVVWVLLAFLTGGIAALVYLVMAIVVPEGPDADGVTAAGAGSAAPTPADRTVAAAAAAGVTPVAPGGWVAPDGSTVPMGAGATSSRAERRAARRAARHASGDGTRGALIGGLILILIGGYFLIRQFVPSIDLGLLWPIAAIVIGILLAVMALLPPRRPG